MRPTHISETKWTLQDSSRTERRIRALGTRLPHPQFLSHLSAAAVWGFPLPTLGTGDPIHVSVISPQPRPRSNGITGHELDGRVTNVVTVDGIRVSDAASTWCQLAGILTLPDLVAAADAIIMPENAQEALVTIEDLNTAVNIRKGHRGAGQLRDALDLVRSGSKSRIESVIRVFMQFIDMPEPEMNLDIASEDGYRTHIPIAFSGFGVGVDVNVEADRAFRTRSAELERLARLDDLGWRMVSFSDADVHPSRQYELRKKLLSLQHLLMQQGWIPGDTAA